MILEIRRIASSVVALVLGACGSGLDLPEAALISIVGAADNQLAVAGDRLPRPLAARVTTSDGATVVPRAEVRWQVVQGVGATLSDSLTVSDGTGEAQVTVVLGPDEGTYLIRATLVAKSGQTVTYSAIATTRPRLTSVEPTQFGGGDTITLRGTGLRSFVRVEVNSRPATVVGISVMQTAMSVVAPYCLAPGPVTIAARVGLSSSQLGATYVAGRGLLELEPGEYASVEPVALADCATVPAADMEGADYLFAPQSVTSAAGTSTPYRLLGDSVVSTVTAPAPDAGPRPLALVFHDFLRAQEAELGREARTPYAPQEVLAVRRAGIEVGDRRSFKVCNSITCSEVRDFSDVTAEAKYVGKHAALYVDVDAPNAGLTDGDFSSLGELFDSDLYGVATAAFGAESDVDRNGLVFVLLTPVVNQLTPPEQCPTSFITGFFFSLDTDPSRASDPRSNQAEVFYGIVPDPQGTVTCDHSVNRVRRIVPITFIHELQHIINFYQHTILRGGGSEETWLNEAMSHLAEELGAFHFRSKNDSVRFSAFAAGNLFNAFQYLSAPGAHAPLFSGGTGTLAERGAGWLLLRWLSDQFGPTVIRRMSETGRVGAANVANAVGEDLSSLLSDWFVANYVSDLPMFAEVPRLRYTTWDFRAVYQSLHDQAPDQFTRPFPILPFEFFGGTFAVTGTLRAGSGDYVSVKLRSGAAGFSARLVDAAGNPLAGPAAPRLHVIRLR